MKAGVASKDCVGTDFNKGSQLPSNTAFQSLVPLCHLLYSKPMKLIHHYPGHSLESVEVGNGMSQGCTTADSLPVLSSKSRPPSVEGTQCRKCPWLHWEAAVSPIIANHHGAIEPFNSGSVSTS